MIEILKQVISLMPQVIELIRQVETFFPMPGVGKDKLEMVRSLLQKTYEISGVASVSFDALWPVLSTLIASMVAIYNKTGVFKGGV